MVEAQTECKRDQGREMNSNRIKLGDGPFKSSWALAKGGRGLGLAQLEDSQAEGGCVSEGLEEEDAGFLETCNVSAEHQLRAKLMVQPFNIQSIVSSAQHL